ncbi:adenylate/guanylate cyclase domain-containing protein [Zunongwangia sp. F260]|uniref:Adenylate/guanylate cyclase domain-containing protein n=1 Tax=Autumnicola lenta TaxID=3075593 RepID=A0ABU3CGP6_9FLAO|nr:adenylate/guanylate cyclase domain-containing protein [Zunongwangia sp. F260]MDT0645528.1 adenylate/guanylate cyclase domain-containing protein [Zunongwangia sp. F260]
MYQKYLLRVPVYIVVWVVAIGGFTFLREFGQVVIKDYIPFGIYQQIGVHLILGVIAGIIFGSLQFIFEKFIYKFVSLGVALLLGTLTYLIAIFSLLSFAIVVFAGILEEDLHVKLYMELLFSKEMLPIMMYCFFITSLINFVSEIDKKFGPGNLRKMLTGKFYSPKEEERIFMFMDLRSSTSIAEKLGHIKYSELIQDCFKAISVVEIYKAEVYQYVGDEVVLTWKKQAGLKDNRCIKAYLAFQEKILKKRKYYIEMYETFPEFKAGMHIGKITVAEVGEIKREIAYHGNTINTASRIQEECNAMGKDFLMSEDILKNITETEDFKFEYEGNIRLKGKNEAIKIYSLNQSC